MSDPFVAEIRMFGFNFAPKGWAACNGQLLPISQNTALFSLLGTYYGGDGKVTFGLPNLQDSFALGVGQGPGLSLYDIGERGGSGTVSLLSSEMPAHSHALMAGASAQTDSPAGAALAPPAAAALAYRIPGNQVAMAGDSNGAAGGSQPHENRSPYLAVNFCIAMQGIYPPRS
ncbi:tail fiber protein [Paucibacter sediminis]|uniref:Tail fiber protein n=1 Tax=Paucibacter sediminis TaxID=3019553 RepID=A0AA95SPN5_9BURK|nr:tail fiber protein [Paucibacter sp. S2-9]WIT13912.1 tail fiber protein [Paucibacter sp. S2-9]